ncbi:MAG: CoA pyrophosphatase [Desulfitobacteriaceae bacterium]
MRKEQIVKLKDVLLPLVTKIQGSEENYKSAVLVLLVLLNDEYHLVFQKRALSIRQGGEICFPGGHYDPKIDSDFEHTALRETVEELGIAEGKLNIVGKLHNVFTSSGAIIYPYVGIADIQDKAEITLDKREVEYIFTVPVAYFEKNKPEVYQVCLKNFPSFVDEKGNEITTFPARELGLPEKYTKPWGDRKSQIYVYKVQGEIIWGATAKIIYEFIQRVNLII